MCLEVEQLLMSHHISARLFSVHDDRLKVDEDDVVLTLVRVAMFFWYKVVNAVILDSGTSILLYGYFCLVVAGSICKINLY
jgi:hypothetical protein